MTIRVLSFDFDGCLFNTDYIYSAEKDVIASNKIFLDALKAQNGLYRKKIALVGSNRQSQKFDEVNAYKFDPKHGLLAIGSCYPALKKITDYLDIEYDPFLLADLYGDLPYGTSFERAINALENQDSLIEHAQWLFDETKATVLYAQMHKIAYENPDEEIVFDFFDDRGNKKPRRDILEWLHDFYTKFPELIPPNVTLRLNHYNGGETTLLSEIKGLKTSFIDENYPQTTMDMAKITMEKCPYADGLTKPLHTADYVTADLLLNRSPFIKAGSSDTVRDSRAQSVGKINAADLEIVKGRSDSFSSPIEEEPKQLLWNKHQYSFFNCAKIFADFSNSYTCIWSQVQGNSMLRKIHALLLDYTKEDTVFGSKVGLAFTGHWNRHHVDDVSAIIAAIANNKYDLPDDILHDLKALNPRTGGSLFRRIEFIEKELTEQREDIFSPLI